MSETPPATSSVASTPPSSAADQARIRKERREAKIRAGGSARLNKITGLGGGIQRDPPSQPSTSPSVRTTDPTADPDEVDISEHFYQPARSTSTNSGRPIPDFRTPNADQQLNDEQLRAMMLGNALPPQDGQPPNPFAGGNPFAGFPGMDAMGGPPGEMGDDPMMKMLQQMMGGMGGMPGGMGGPPGSEGFPPGGMPPGFPGMSGMPGQQAAADPYAYIWRIIHAFFALSLGLYIAFTTTFSGSKLEREMSGVDASILATDRAESFRFFYIFATAEVLLQTSRFFLEKGQTQQSGILGTVMGFLPMPYKGYLNVLLRYGRIWTTMTADAMCCVFVLGVCCWFKGA